MKSFLERIKSKEILIGDGAMGSLLMAMAKDLSKNPARKK